MAKVTAPLLSQTAQGSIGKALTFRNVGGSSIVNFKQQVGHPRGQNSRQSGSNLRTFIFQFARATDRFIRLNPTLFFRFTAANGTDNILDWIIAEFPNGFLASALADDAWLIYYSNLQNGYNFNPNITTNNDRISEVISEDGGDIMDINEIRSIGENGILDGIFNRAQIFSMITAAIVDRNIEDVFGVVETNEGPVYLPNQDAPPDRPIAYQFIGTSTHQPPLTGIRGNNEWVFNNVRAVCTRIYTFSDGEGEPRYRDWLWMDFTAATFPQSSIDELVRYNIRIGETEFPFAGREVLQEFPRFITRTFLPGEREAWIKEVENGNLVADLILPE